MIRRIPWTAGPAESTTGPVFISVTDFTTARWRHVPGVALNGMRLRRAWPRMQGAVGMWLWADPLRRRSGSISVWTSEEDLRRFVRWPVHMAIVRRYRSRGTLTASSWTAERFERPEALRDAMHRLG